MKARDRLEAQLAELKQRLAHVEADLAEPLNADEDDRPVDAQSGVSLDAQAVLIRREIASVDRALERIASGTWGICVRCEGGIAPARLEARPEAALCIDCARKK
jgi:RNA polymerase-binding transcription factor DksA